MTSKRSYEFPILTSPKLDMVVPAGRSDPETIGAESCMADLLLVALKAGDGFCAFGGFPEIHCHILGGCDKTFRDLIVDGCGSLEAFLCLCDFPFLGWGDFVGVVVIGGSEYEFGREG